MSKTAFASALAAFTGVIVVFTAAALPASASAEPVLRSHSVTYTDLDLSTQAGKRMLDRRIARTARTVCGMDDAVTGTRLRSADASACYDQAVRNTRMQIAQAAAAARKGG